jgi:hypothetical protein
MGRGRGDKLTFNLLCCIPILALCVMLSTVIVCLLSRLSLVRMNNRDTLQVES